MQNSITKLIINLNDVINFIVCMMEPWLINFIRFSNFIYVLLTYNCNYVVVSCKPTKYIFIEWVSSGKLSKNPKHQTYLFADYQQSLTLSIESIVLLNLFVYTC